MNLVQPGILSSSNNGVVDYDLELEVVATADPTAVYTCIFTRGTFSDSLSCPAPANGTSDTGTLKAIPGTTTVQAEAIRYPNAAAYAGTLTFLKNGVTQYVHIFDPAEDAGYIHTFTSVSPADLLEAQYFEA
jgi:hypothetical protein